MIKVKVLRRFLDKQKNVIQPVGKILDLSGKRYEQIIAYEGDPLVEKMEDSSDEKAKDKKQKPTK